MSDIESKKATVAKKKYDPEVYQKNKENVRAAQRRYYEKNRAKLSEYRANYYREHKDRFKELREERNAKRTPQQIHDEREKHREASRQHYARNKEAVKARVLARYHATKAPKKETKGTIKVVRFFDEEKD